MTLGSEFSVHSHPLGTHPGGTHCAVYSFGTWTLYSPHPHVFIHLETGSVTRTFRTITEVIRRKSWGSLPYSTAQPTCIQHVKPQPMYECYHTQAYPIHGWRATVPICMLPGHVWSEQCCSSTCSAIGGNTCCCLSCAVQPFMSALLMTQCQQRVN